MSIFPSLRPFFYFLFAGLFIAVLPSCSEFSELFEEEPAPPTKKVYAPGEIRANDIEYIALCEAGQREGTDINFRSFNVVEKNDLYYVHIKALPYKEGTQRTVVVNDSGEVVQYLKGIKYP